MSFYGLEKGCVLILMLRLGVWSSWGNQGTSIGKKVNIMGPIL